MAKKIEGVLTGTQNGEGYELGKGKGWCDFWEGKERTFGKGKSNASLVDFGQEPHERVFTESEVRAIIETCKTEAVFAVNAMSNWHRGTGPMAPPVAFGIDKACEKKHGIVLDPA